MSIEAREQRLLNKLSSGSAVTRMSCDVAGEQVTLFARDGSLRAVCTCGVQRCEHYAQALLFFEPNEILLEAQAASDPRLRSSLRPPAASGVDDLALADALDAVLLAVVRSGVHSASSPSVKDAIERLLLAAPMPTPLGLSRWLGRLHEALQRADVGKTARVLEGARVFADELRLQPTTSEQKARRAAWLFPAGTGSRAVSPLESATLIEVAREWLSGVERNAIERRYLLDLERGDVLREEHARADNEISVGPCPRVLQVAFGELEGFGAPRRVRLLQYTVSAAPTDGQWAKTESFAKRLVRHVSDTYENAVSTCPGLVEPFMLVAPRSMDLSSKPAWVDHEGERMALVEDASQPTSDLLSQLVQGARVVWLAGRLVGLAQGLLLKPISLLVQRSDGLHLLRVT